MIKLSQLQSIQKEKNNTKDEIIELAHMKKELVKELQNETGLVSGLSQLTLKYKKLLLEQKREKEKLI